MMTRCQRLVSLLAIATPLIFVVRVLCFPASQVAAQVDAQTPIEDWWYTETQDKMTDKVTSLTLTENDEDSLSFSFLCRAYEPTAILMVSDPRLRLELIEISGDQIHVQARFGDNQPTDRHTWTPLGSSEYEAYEAPQAFSYKLLREARDAAYMHLRIWNSSDEIVTTARFSLMGATEANLKLPCVVEGTFAPN